VVVDEAEKRRVVALFAASGKWTCVVVVVASGGVSEIQNDVGLAPTVAFATVVGRNRGKTNAEILE